MNTGGNMPSLLAPVFGMLIDRLGWQTTIASGSVFAVLGAILWLMVTLKDVSGAAAQSPAVELY